LINEFFETAANLKNIPRKGWMDKLGIISPESVADHCYSTTLMAMVVSDLQNLDTKKVTKMSLLHDLAESITGDFTPNSISKKNKEELEDKIMNEILNNLPEALFQEYMSIWKEYQDKKTKESVLVHEVDKLEMALQAKIYSKQGFSKEKLESFLKTANEEIQNNDLKTIFKDIVNTI
jgi:putative hydrolase of HD superfamily